METARFIWKEMRFYRRGSVVSFAALCGLDKYRSKPVELMENAAISTIWPFAAFILGTGYAARSAVNKTKEE